MDTTEKIVEGTKEVLDPFFENVASRTFYDIDKVSQIKLKDGSDAFGRFLVARVKYQRENGKIIIMETLPVHEFLISELEPNEATLKEVEKIMNEQAGEISLAAPAAPSAAALASAPPKTAATP